MNIFRQVLQISSSQRAQIDASGGLPSLLSRGDKLYRVDAERHNPVIYRKILRTDREFDAAVKSWAADDHKVTITGIRKKFRVDFEKAKAAYSRYQSVFKKNI